MATEHFLISKDNFNNVIRKANELGKKNIDLEKSTAKVLPKEIKEIYHNKIEDDDEGENNTQDEYFTTSSTSSSGDDSYNTSESKSGVGITLKQESQVVSCRAVFPCGIFCVLLWHLLDFCCFLFVVSYL